MVHVMQRLSEQLGLREVEGTPGVALGRHGGENVQRRMCGRGGCPGVEFEDGMKILATVFWRFYRDGTYVGAMHTSRDQSKRCLGFTDTIPQMLNVTRVSTFTNERRLARSC